MADTLRVLQAYAYGGHPPHPPPQDRKEHPLPSCSHVLSGAAGPPSTMEAFTAKLTHDEELKIIMSRLIAQRGTEMDEELSLELVRVGWSADSTTSSTWVPCSHSECPKPLMLSSSEVPEYPALSEEVP